MVWESFPDDAVSSYGIYYRQFDANAFPLTGDVQANRSARRFAFAGDQVNPSIAMDADGDFVISWDGNGAPPTQLNPNTLT